MVVAEQSNGQLRDVTLELISAATAFGPTSVLVIGAEPAALADRVDVAGVAEILLVKTDTNHLSSDCYRSVVGDVINDRRPDLILVAASADGTGFAAAVAAKHGLGFAADVHGIRYEDGELVATRSFYSGKVHADLEFPGREGVLLTLRTGSWQPATGTGDATRTVLTVKRVVSQLEHLDLIVPASNGEADLTRADLILAVGRGIGEQENLELFEALAAKMGAALAVSRPLVDAGWAPASRQVGQSGKTVKPKLYLAFGISGASQHLAGMQGSETVVAINSDPAAAIFSVADYGGVFDAIELARELEKLY